MKYLRIVDRSARSQFGGGADGYDVDGVVAINSSNCSSIDEVAFRTSAIEYGVIDELPNADVYPNPFNEMIKVSVFTAEEDEKVEVSVFTFEGRQVISTSFFANSAETNEFVIPTQNLSNGIYLLEINSISSGKQTRRIVKN